MAQNVRSIRRKTLEGLGLALWAFFAVLSGPVEAAQPGQFEVLGVTVDVTADSAQTARAQALAAGEKKAFRQLLQRLTLQAYHDRLPDVSAAEITGLIVDFAVADEKASSVRYIAKLDYHFRGAGVRGARCRCVNPTARAAGSNGVRFLAVSN